LEVTVYQHVKATIAISGLRTFLPIQRVWQAGTRSAFEGGCCEGAAGVQKLRCALCHTEHQPQKLSGQSERMDRGQKRIFLCDFCDLFDQIFFVLFAYLAYFSVKKPIQVLSLQ
jgi:hypothetical protein